MARILKILLGLVDPDEISWLEEQHQDLVGIDLAHVKHDLSAVFY